MAALQTLFRSGRAKGGAPPVLRDTDSDWRLLGAEEPHWGVLTAPEYRQDRLDGAALETFYASGRQDAEWLAGLVESASGRPVRGGRALDFGCGVGRITEAMLDFADEVTGVDVSPGMLAHACARSGRVAYAEALPDGVFDWVNSYIVLQHIPPARGLAYVGELLDRLAPGGALTLQLPFAWKAGLDFDPVVAAETAPEGSVVVYTYDLNVVLELLWAKGLRRHALAPTDHGGVYGFVIAGRRDAA